MLLFAAAALALAAGFALAAAAGGYELLAPAPIETGVLGAPPIDGPEGEEGAGFRLGGLEGESVLLEGGVVFFFMGGAAHWKLGAIRKQLQRMRRAFVQQ